MEEFYGRKYKLKTSENFEEYLKFIEIGYISRKTAMAVSPVVCLTKNEDGTLTMSMTTPIRNIESKFRLNEEYEEERADGVKVKSSMVMEGNKLIQTQIENNGRKTTNIREFTDDKLIVTTTADGWDGTCIRTYDFV